MPSSVLPKVCVGLMQKMGTSLLQALRLVPIPTPALQLIPIPIGTPSRHPCPHGGGATRCMSINPYTGLDTREEDREWQRKMCQHGLKVEWADFSTTINDRARSRLYASAMERRRTMEGSGVPRRRYTSNGTN
eukprot:CAMPEP_0183735302 /NCGR_PEP_ID=MMETSP0737-20130205/46246_1 /TAXON_ID=385413 /ORGANISM="Thalassiosira miniscula, Strain CCMP1093" /LENGTH=132 /DNA_ID=CAMNT_0025969001 /DNA_START=1 /DNA_END=399 /DNA_ORIENTATION=+